MTSALTGPRLANPEPSHRSRKAQAGGRARAEALARRLRMAACVPGGSAAPISRPGDPAFLGWLRGMTYSGLHAWAEEEVLARRWVGGDIFASRRAGEAPGFLAEVDVCRLPPHLVAPLLRRLSLVRPAPEPTELTVEALAADAGPVSSCPRTGAARRWGQPDGAPPLPVTTVIPHIVHGIWLGRALPAANNFWAHYGAAADHYAGEVDFVLWTDIPRARFDAARAAPPGRPDALQPVRDLLAWADSHGIHLVNVSELFHANAPMALHTLFALELNQRNPRAFAAASDHLRVEVIHRFGGMYADGDLHLVPETPADPGEPAADRADGHAGAGYRLFRGRWQGPPDADGPCRLPELFDRVAAARHGFTLHVLNDEIVLNDLIVSPAGHPALALWLEGARYNYLRDQREVFGTNPWPQRPGEQPPKAEPASWTWTVTSMRSGRVHHWMLARLGIAGADLVKSSPAVRGHSELSWLPPVVGEPALPSQDPDPMPTLVACVDQLRWQCLSRPGDLYLTSVAALIRGLPEPDTAWIALLLAFAELSTDLVPIASVTDTRRNQDGSLDVVVLPPEAEALLDRAADPDTWFGSDAGTGREFWFLGERTVPVRLRNGGSGECRAGGSAG